MAKRKSRISELHTAAEVRLYDFFRASADYSGTEIPPEMRDHIRVVINSIRKTYRYMLFVGLLVAVTDQKLHPRCLQLKAGCEGAFDARSLCKSVVVPFEKKMLKGCLGGSCDPYVSNPARLPMVEKDNDAKGALDRDHLSRMYDVLEYAKASDLGMRKSLFRYAYGCVLKRQPQESSLADFGDLSAAGLGPDPFFDFLEAPTLGASAVATLAAYFRRFYGKDVRVIVHPLTESGSSPKEVGDIDLKFKDGRIYAVEVKDKPYTDVDVNHACEKALSVGVHRVIFAYGAEAEKKRPQDGVLVSAWSEKGVELTFLSIESALSVAMAVSDEMLRQELAQGMAEALGEMNAPGTVVDQFTKIFNVRRA